jgi:hypothetical protein
VLSTSEVSARFLVFLSAVLYCVKLNLKKF